MAKNKMNVLLIPSILLSMSSCSLQEYVERIFNNNKESELESESVVEKTVFDKDMYYEEKEEYVFEDLEGKSSDSTQLSTIFKSQYEDEDNNINANSIKYAELYVDGDKKDDITSNYTFNNDARLVFYNDSNARVINRSEGYAFTMKTDKVLKVDLSKSQYRTQYSNDESILTVTMESKNPYQYFKTYDEEFLSTYINDPDFLKANNLEYTREVSHSTQILSGYTVDQYDIFIKDSEKVERPYYNIAVIRKSTSQQAFAFFVMKSKTNQNALIDQIVKSYKESLTYGKVNTSIEKYELKIPSYWSEETQLYFKYLLEKPYCDWGMFVNSIGEAEATGENSFLSKTYQNQKKYSEWMDYNFEILPTYAHVGKLIQTVNFPVEQAKSFAGGNGYNGKPVIQFTLQYTTSNNENLSGYTPIFDILRGKYDDYFKEMAKKLKSYSHPVLFRLNNEMNTDWVSYCGLVSLDDPDIFIYTYERMANIFKDEGANNVIFIFNPNSESSPDSNWGEDICYLPSMEFVNVLGLTSYRQNNSRSNTAPVPFAILYEDLYNKNLPFRDFPAIISEFGCGAGGASSGVEYRNVNTQAAWVEEMFLDLNYLETDWAKQIKGAVWFSVNDLSGTGKTANLYELDKDKTKETIEVFKTAFDELEELKNSYKGGE